MNRLEQRPTVATPSAQLCYRLDLEMNQGNWLAALILLNSKKEIVDTDVLKRKTIIYFEAAQLFQNDPKKLETSLASANEVLARIEDPQTLLNRITIYKTLMIAEKIREDELHFREDELHFVDLIPISDASSKIRKTYNLPEPDKSALKDLTAPILSYLLSQLKKKNNWDKIINVCSRSKSLISSSPEIGNKYAQAYVMKKDFQGALKIYDEILASIADPHAQQGKVECLIQLDLLQEAAKENRILAQIVPGNPMSSYFSLLLLSKTSVEEAMMAINTYKQKNPSFPPIDDLESCLAEQITNFFKEAEQPDSKKEEPDLPS